MTSGQASTYKDFANQNADEAKTLDDQSRATGTLPGLTGEHHLDPPSGSEDLRGG